jgi:alpha-amylase
MNVIAFTILFDGVPMIYQGQEQHLNGAFPPNNREALWLTNYNTNAPLYQLMAKLNKIRRQAGRVDPNYFNVFSYPIFTGKSEVAIRKGNEGRQTILVLSTNGETGGQYSLVLPVTYQPGTVVTEIMTCVNYTINESGQLNLLMDKGQPRVLFPANQMGDSGLCGVGDWSPAGTPSQNNSLYDHWSAGSSTSLYSNRPSLWLLTAISSLIYSATILVL